MKNEDNFGQLLDTIKTRKEEAKLYRDDGDYQEAIDVLDEAVKMIEESGWEHGLETVSDLPEDRKTVAWNLADCLGMMGGNYRRMNRFDEALACFQRGRKYEEDTRFAVNSSYNLLNAITLPIERRDKTAVAGQSEALQRAVEVLERQVRGERRVDRWAWADLGECRLLLGDLNGASEAYKRFIELGDDDSMQSVLNVLQRLGNALSELDQVKWAVVLQGIQQLKGMALHRKQRVV